MIAEATVGAAAVATACVVRIVELQRVERGRPFVARNEVEHVGAAIGHDRHVGSAARCQRLHEEHTRAMVGRDLPLRRIADRDIFDPFVGTELDGRLNSGLADYLHDLVGDKLERANSAVRRGIGCRGAKDGKGGKDTRLPDHRTISRGWEVAAPATRWWR
jgi:hypothetical protein